jgi:hypothetical protein
VGHSGGGLEAAGLLAFKQFQFAVKAVECAEVAGNINENDGSSRVEVRTV